MAFVPSTPRHHVLFTYLSVYVIQVKLMYTISKRTYKVKDAYLISNKVIPLSGGSCVHNKTYYVIEFVCPQKWHENSRSTFLRIVSFLCTLKTLIFLSLIAYFSSAQFLYVSIFKTAMQIEQINQANFKSILNHMVDLKSLIWWFKQSSNLIVIFRLIYTERKTKQETIASENSRLLINTLVVLHCCLTVLRHS